jgi:hypothetical protein
VQGNLVANCVSDKGERLLASSSQPCEKALLARGAARTEPTKALRWTYPPHHSLRTVVLESRGGDRGARLTLLIYQVAEARRIGCAAARCSDQADLHLTFIDPM